MIEMVVVLILMTIIAATVLGRSITMSNLDLNQETDKIRNHLRFAQAEAMKLAYKDPSSVPVEDYLVWGISFESGQYWLFRGKDPNIASEQVRLPGVEYPVGSSKVSLPSGFSLTATKPTVFFDRIGKPYESYTDEKINNPLIAEMQVTVSHGESRTIRIEPETGLVR